MQVWKKLSFVFITLLSIVSLVAAQDDCPTDVNDALVAMSEICLAIGRNQACYGNGDVVAVPQANTVINFSEVGDTAAVDDIQSLTLSPYEIDLNEWGIAVLVVQADIPETLPGQNVTMLLFGDVDLSNDGGAYYFTSGIGSPTCNQAPNGILIQTPEGAGTVNLTINGINISLGSTAFLGTLEEDILTFALLEGESSLSIEDSEVEVAAEEFTTIELDEDLNAVGEFTEPASIDELDLPLLPLDLLPEAIEDDSEDGGDATVSGDPIVPLSGTWLYTAGEFSFDGCPDFFITAFEQAGVNEFGFGFNTTQDLTFDSENRFDAVFDTSVFADSGMAVDVSTPEPNVYQITISVEDAVTINYTWTIVSETLIEGEIDQTLVFEGLGTCNVHVPVTIEYQG